MLIIADNTANPQFIAADLLAQSEHDPQARGILIATDRGLIEDTIRYLEEFLQKLSTEPIARKAWNENGMIYLVDHLSEAVELSNKNSSRTS